MKDARFCQVCGHALSHVEGGERPRLTCAQCGYVHYGSPVPVVAALVEHDGHVILVRNQGWPDGMFGLVTGYLERDEEPAAGALRELHEELRLRGTVVGIIGSYAFQMKNEVVIAYHVRAEGPIVQSKEIAEYKRVPIGKLRPWPIATGLAVRDWLLARAGEANQHQGSEP